MGRPLVLAAASYMGGIVLRDFLPLPMGLLLFSGLAAGMWWVWNRYYAWHKSPLPFLACGLILGMLMNHWVVLRTEALLAVKTGIRAEFTGIITEEPVRKGDRIAYVVEVRRVQQKDRQLKIKGKILVNIKKTGNALAYGELVRFYGIPELPPEPGNPGQFNYRKYLYNKGLVLVVNLGGDSAVKKLQSGCGNPLVAAAIKVKSRLAGVLDQTLPPEKSALLKGVLFGSRAEIDPDIRQEFIDTGVVHILSVSGYHTGLVLAGCMLLNGVLRLNRRPFTFFAAAVLIFYTAMTGVQPAVVRATVMALVLLAGHLLEKDRDWPAGLALSALVILGVNPRIIYNIGFQLSFVATWGILYIAPVLQSRLFYRLPQSWRPVPAVPLAAQLAVLPLSAFYFNQVSVISLLANLLIVPLIGVVTLLGTFAVLGGAAWTLWAAVLNVSTGLLLSLVIKINSFLAGLPGAVLSVQSPPVWVVGLWFAGIILLVEGFCCISFNQFLRRIFYIRRRLIVTTGLMLLLPAVMAPLVYQPVEPLTVTFIDVGEGDSVLVRTPRGRVMLIDTGGSAGGGVTDFDTGARILVPVLRNYGVSRVDALVLTHMHTDHAGGAPAVLQRMQVEKLVLPPSAVNPALSKQNRRAQGNRTLGVRENPAYTEDRLLAEITGLADKKSIPIVPVSAGSRIILDPDISIEVLAPLPDKIYGGPADSNNSSIVLKLSYGQDTVLLTGDIEAATLETLMAGRRDIRADVLKIPHHGSRNSLSGRFYRKVDPDLAVISVGRNFFGHPAGEVLDELKANDIRITRTDLHGAVTLTSEGHGWRGQTVKKGEI